MRKSTRKMAYIIALALMLANIGWWQGVDKADAAVTLPGLSYLQKVIYISEDRDAPFKSLVDSYKDTCKVPIKNNKGYTVTYEATGKYKDLVNVTDKGVVTATYKGLEVGAVDIKVTFSKAKERDVVCTFKVMVRRNATAIRLSAASQRKIDQKITVGQKIKLQVEKTYKKDKKFTAPIGLDNYRLYVTDSVQVVLANSNLAEVEKDGITIVAKAAGTLEFTIRALQQGSNKRTGVVSNKYTMRIEPAAPTATPTPTAPPPTPTPAASARQVERKVIELKTNRQFTTVPTNDSISLTKGASSTKLEISDMKIDKADPTKLLIETRLNMDNSSEYSVAYNGATYKFTTTDGTVRSIKIMTNEAEVLIDTPVQIYTYDKGDKSGVILDKYPYSGTSIPDHINISGSSSYGTLSSNNIIYMWEVGRTMALEAEYHTYTPDAQGKEITYKDNITVRCINVKPIEIALTRYTVSSSEVPPDFTSNITQNLNLPLYGNGYHLYYYMEDSKGNDLSKDCTFEVESADWNTLMVSGYGTPISPRGVRVEDLYALRSSTRTIPILVKLNNEVKDRININITAESRLDRITLLPAALELSNSIPYATSVAITGVDQYDQRMSGSYSISCTEAPSTAIRSAINSNMLQYAEIDGDIVDFYGYGMSKGRYTFWVSSSTSSNVGRNISITVVEPNPASKNTTYAIVSTTGNDNVDTAVPITGAEDKYFTFRVIERKDGIPYRYLEKSDLGGLKIKHPNNTVSSIIDNDTGMGVYYFKYLDVTSNPTVWKLATGTYTITAEIGGKVIATKTFYVQDSQSQGMSFSSIRTSVYSGTLKAILSEAFNFTYRGYGVSVDDATRVRYHTLPLASSSAPPNDVVASTTNIPANTQIQIVDVTINVIMGSYTVPITINMNGARINTNRQ